MNKTNTLYDPKVSHTQNFYRERSQLSQLEI